MKIGSIGINTYRHVQNLNNVSPNNNLQQSIDNVSSKLTITPQQENKPSAVSLRPATVVVENVLNNSEKAALDQVLKVISENSASKLGYTRNDRNIESPDAIGNIIDVKV